MVSCGSNRLTFLGGIRSGLVNLCRTTLVGSEGAGARAVAGITARSETIWSSQVFPRSDYESLSPVVYAKSPESWVVFEKMRRSVRRGRNRGAPVAALEGGEDGKMKSHGTADPRTTQTVLTLKRDSYADVQSIKTQCGKDHCRCPSLWESHRHYDLSGAMWHF
ncbi:hypothetical protein GN956_G9335 [Arapaima gigas]